MCRHGQFKSQEIQNFGIKKTFKKFNLVINIQYDTLVIEIHIVQLFKIMTIYLFCSNSNLNAPKRQ